MSSTQSAAHAAAPKKKGSRYDPSKPHITETPITSANWYKHVNWLNVAFIIGMPLFGMVNALWTPLQTKTAVFAVIYYFLTGLGITMGSSPSLYFYCGCSRLMELQDTTDCGLIPPIPLPFLSKSCSLLSAVELWKDRSDGGPETIVLTTVIPTRIRIRTLSARDSSPLMLAGWS